MRATVADLVALVGGTLHGPADAGARVLTNAAALDRAGGQDLSFFGNPRYLAAFHASKAGAVLVAAHDAKGPAVQIVVPSPDMAFAQVAMALGPKPVPPAVGIHPTAVIGEGVRIGTNVRVGPYVVIDAGAQIGNGVTLYAHTVIGAQAQIGDDSLLYPFASVRERCRLGARVILQNGVVIGGDGFGYATIGAVHHKIPQSGIVIVDDDVEIGANATIDRARFGVTRIGAGTKIDNLVMVAHNVEVGKGCLLVAQCGIAGSSKLGNFVTLAGQSAVVGHVTIGDKVILGGQAGVTKDIAPGTMLRGSPAIPHRDALRQEIAVRRLGETQDTVKDLTKRVAELEAKLAALLAKSGGAG